MHLTVGATPALCSVSDPTSNVNWWVDETHLSVAGGVRLAPHFLDLLATRQLIEPGLGQGW